MTPSRRRSAWLLLVASAIAANAHSEPCPIPRHAITSVSAAVELAKRAIVTYKLTDTPLRCLAVAPSPGFSGTGFEIDVRENHLEGCGEALPMFDPLVMSIHVTPAGLLTTTAGAPDARPAYRRPRCPRPSGQAPRLRG